MCLRPITLKTKAVVPCGTCPDCLAKKRADWSFRMQEEERVSSSSFFMTYTYTEEKLHYNEDGNAILFPSDFQNYMKRIRKLTSNKLKYFAVGEYGGESGRPHYHAIIFNFPAELRWMLIHEWNEGFAVLGDTKQGSIHYVTKYMLKPSKWYIKQGMTPPFTLVSKGLGINYVKKNKESHKLNESLLVKNNGYNQSMPRYYQDKIFDRIHKDLIRKNLVEENTRKEALAEKKAISKSKNYFKELAEREQKARDDLFKLLNSELL